jgi:nucleotide-binding universal stress UspA family protein
MFNKVMVGYSGDQAGEDAVRLAQRLLDIGLEQLTVVFPYRPLLSSASAEEVEQRVRLQVDALTDARLGKFARCTYRWSPARWPIRALHELAEYERADLIVFGRAQTEIAEQLHIGLMERMVHGAPCAVAVAPPHFRVSSAPWRHVGVGFSESRESLAALDLAAELGKLAHAELEVIGVAGIEQALISSYALPPSALIDLEAELYAQTQRTLAHIAGELSDQLPATPITLSGSPARTLVERSAQLELLVLGSRAYGPLRYALLGSVSAPVMRQADCPVLIVPRGTQAATDARDDASN